MRNYRAGTEARSERCRTPESSCSPLSRTGKSSPASTASPLLKNEIFRCPHKTNKSASPKPCLEIAMLGVGNLAELQNYISKIYLFFQRQCSFLRSVTKLTPVSNAPVRAVSHQQHSFVVWLCCQALPACFHWEEEVSSEYGKTKLWLTQQNQTDLTVWSKAHRLSETADSSRLSFCLHSISTELIPLQQNNKVMRGAPSRQQPCESALAPCIATPATINTQPAQQRWQSNIGVHMVWQIKEYIIFIEQRRKHVIPLDAYSKIKAIWAFTYSFFYWFFFLLINLCHQTQAFCTLWQLLEVITVDLMRSVKALPLWERKWFLVKQLNVFPYHLHNLLLKHLLYQDTWPNRWGKKKSLC